MFHLFPFLILISKTTSNIPSSLSISPSALKKKKKRRRRQKCINSILSLSSRRSFPRARTFFVLHVSHPDVYRFYFYLCLPPPTLAGGLVRPPTSEILKFRKKLAHDCFSKWSRAACREEDLVVYIASSRSQGFCLIAKAHESTAACQCLQLAALTIQGNWTKEEKLCEPIKVPFSSYLRTINANDWKHFCSTLEVFARESIETFMRKE